MIDGKISKFAMIGQNLQNGLFNQMHDGKGIPHRSNGGTSRQVWNERWKKPEYRFEKKV